MIDPRHTADTLLKVNEHLRAYLEYKYPKVLDLLDSEGEFWEQINLMRSENYENHTSKS